MSDLAQYRRPFWNTQPAYRFDAYGSTLLRSPNEPLIAVPQTLSEITGPAFGAAFVKQGDNDLTRIASADAIGERIIVSGRVLDENGRPVPDALIEIWQANAAGRYLHKRDQHDAPLDPNFSGEGRTVTDAHGRYQFKTIKPGAYPWGNHYNGWRPQHIHFSLFGRAYATRLVTQMYFPGDPLLEFDPIFQCVPDAKARARLVATLDWETTVPDYALGYRFDIVLRGRNATPME
ncbi:protocatechuate 3,4-dioxygenase subunit beta [Achromobacter sp. LC458]|uniref:Protocatechuate 3,4-dioxygenase subunit beta n=1 Tax=Achromobacter spanius TaxID=217203 RepID=A0A2S5GR53_9BURK|nr:MULTISPECIES: protocatechuate 3,4-dioxygenase subunit beta [Achromobacter]AYD65797.1 protocatechuate 3,4-dioxygenase subunit beta [Achromobacter sp. B7]MDX3986192.1 protocatechuate 3,4-dioxygenase subunit beta [Achromobacter sp.]PPA75394.1 protocatechuate 3,4-dioxygenase subunit beta [Achromobacter spanius]QYJ19934.1 protocatechuate 3,4-dioxygenase subunit beta [Achromobacter sp. ES-001]TRM52422.1 protocatechuate 3,4-dioxygenase subunit beta [Achromobacter sp. LC458]